jgi:hypothetical protein
MFVFTFCRHETTLQNREKLTFVYFSKCRECQFRRLDLTEILEFVLIVSSGIGVCKGLRNFFFSCVLQNFVQLKFTRNLRSATLLKQD